MMKNNSKRVEIDLGASGSRMSHKVGVVDTIPNNMVFLKDTDKVDLVPYDESLSEALEVSIVKEEASPYFPTRALIGNLAERYASGNERPSVASNKLVQRINYVSTITCIACMKLKYNLDDKIKLYLALPPIEVKTSKELATENITGKYKVSFPKFNGGVTVEFEVEEVKCYSESYLAMMSFLFNLDGTIREETKCCLKGYAVSVDIGASTSDFAVTKDGKYLEKSGKTYKIGGNVAREYLVDSIRGEYGYDLPIESAERVMVEGRLPVGNSFRVITDFIEEAKMHLAKELKENIMSYFRQINIPIQMINNIVVSGGGSLESFYLDENDAKVVTSQPTSKFLTDAIHEVCEEVDVIYYGDGARLANINGLALQALVDEKREALVG